MWGCTGHSSSVDSFAAAIFSGRHRARQLEIAVATSPTRPRKMESKLSLGVEQLGADFSQKNGNHSEHMCDLHLNLDDLGCFCLKLCSFHIYCFHKDPGCKQSTNRRDGFHFGRIMAR